MKDVQMWEVGQKLPSHEVQMLMQVQDGAFRSLSGYITLFRRHPSAVEKASNGAQRVRTIETWVPPYHPLCRAAGSSRYSWLVMPTANRMRSAARASAPTQISMPHHATPWLTSRTGILNNHTCTPMLLIGLHDCAWWIVSFVEDYYWVSLVVYQAFFRSSILSTSRS